MDISNLLPQTISPTAYQLAQFGRSPVNHFLGLPQVSIPLTEVRGRGYTLPVTLSYHGGGIKPEQHPGWVGLGWGLQAGGCITRVIRGMKDELSRGEYNSVNNAQVAYDPGYLYHIDETQSGDPWTESQLFERMSEGLFDYEPDEYIVSAPGISTSFVIVGENELRVISRDESAITLEKCFVSDDGTAACLNMYPGQGNDQLVANRYKYIKEFVLRDKEGNRYIFGGTDDAIEYSVVQYPHHEIVSGNLVNTRNWKAIATANSWMLTRIERSDGEVFEFSYEHNGVPIVLRDIHYGNLYSTDEPDLPWLHTYLGRFEYQYDTYAEMQAGRKSNLNFSFLMPCYLTGIRCLRSGDELCFVTENTTELGYEYQEADFTTYVADLTNLPPAVRFSYQEFQMNNYYRKLVRITGVKRDIRLDYTDSSQTRLKLTGVRILQKNDRNDETLVDGRYSFEYNNTPLPGYNSRKTDVWGYYNGTSYAAELASFGIGLDDVRIPSASFMAAETLVAVHYPTGGWTDYEWEPHHYGMTALPPNCLATRVDEAIAGGLRIKSITDYSDSVHSITRSYTYLNDNGLSSGILSALSTCRTEGEHSVNTSELCYQGHFVTYSETPILPLSETDGCHVTYSQVRETFADGGYVEYRYTNSDDGNHSDTHPFREIGRVSGCPVYPRVTSNALFRGLLIWKRLYASDGTLVRSEQMTYGNVGQAYYASAASDKYCGGYIGFISYSKERCGYPALISRTVSELAENGMGINDSYHYTYNDLRLMTSESHSRGDAEDSTIFYYPSDRQGNPFEDMVEDGFLGFPVSTVKLRENVVVDVQELAFTPVPVPCQSEDDNPQTRNSWRPSKVFLGKFSSPVSLQEYLASPQDYLRDTPEIEIKSFDETAFPTYAVQKDGSATELHRSIRYGAAAMLVKSPERAVPDTSSYASYGIPLVQSVIVQESFQTAGSSTPFSCSLSPSPGFAIHLEIVLDNNTYNLAIWCIQSTPDSHWMPLINNYPSTLSLSIPAGSHSLLIRNVEVYVSGGNSQASSCGTLYVNHYRLGQSARETKFIDLDVDDEDGDGFHCTNGHEGPLTVSHTVRAGRQYVLDYMEKTGSDGPWTYRKTAYPGGNVTIGGSGKTVSCVRIYPVDTMPVSYSFEEFTGASAKVDARGISEAYGFDGLGRLDRVYDCNNCLVSQNSYEYATGGAMAASDNYDNIVRTSVITNSSGTNERVTMSHLDGLGRPVQEILVSGGDGVDVVTNKEYDSVGREKRNWITVPVPFGAGRESGELVSESELRAAANGLYPGDDYPFSEKEYEESPRDKVTSVIGPGQAWVSVHKKISYHLNMNVYRPVVMNHFGFSVVQTSSGWMLQRGIIATDRGQLSITETVSEDGESTYEFRNFRGEVVMVRRGIDNDTHYVYDVFGRLAAILPPKLVSVLSSDTRNEWTWSEISNLAFLYCYDSRGNCIAKNIPGAGWTYFAYDKGGRCVFTQDEEQRLSGQWTFSLVDIFGRPCITGTAVRSMDAFDDPIADVNVFVTMASSPVYDGELMGYTLLGLPSLGNSIDVLTVNYYDGYGFLGSGAFPSANDSSVAFDENHGPSYGARFATSNVGMLTGHLTKVLGSGTGNGYLWSVMFYDEKGRVVQKRTSTHLGGVDMEYFGYDFTGAVIAGKTVHCKADGSSLEERLTYTYDNMGRPLVIKHKIGTSAERTVLSNSYDLTGRLLTTGRLSLTSATLTRSYNIRSWLTGISGTRFTEVLDYNTGTTPRYDGKISVIAWKSGTETSLRRYDLSYDSLARLVSAEYSEQSIPQAFSEAYSYDANGNMTHLMRKGLNPAGTALTTLKDIAFTLSGNRMTALDGSTCNYDAKGRMTSSAYGSLWRAAYNILDLPQTESSGNKSISRKYSADGVKLQENSRSGLRILSTRDYVGNCIYEDGVLKKIFFGGGYAEMSGSVPSYRFFLTDHLGSVRVVLNENGSVNQINQYYPFGDLISDPRTSGGTGNNRYRFIAKEQIAETGHYDFGARYLNPLVGRFTTIDPLAEKYPSISPYAYCAGDPVNFVDPYGKETQVISTSNTTYQVCNVILNNDLNIYLVDSNGNYILSANGERTIIGVTPTIYTFYKSDYNKEKEDGPVIKATISVTDKSGLQYLSKATRSRPITFFLKARTNHSWDFKATNGSKKKKGMKLTNNYSYRGMPIGTNNQGFIIYASGRDIGNIAAGYVAGRAGWSWKDVRFFFDKYQGEPEGISSTSAQKFGYDCGYDDYFQELLEGTNTD